MHVQTTVFQLIHLINITTKKNNIKNVQFNAKTIMLHQLKENNVVKIVYLLLTKSNNNVFTSVKIHTYI